MNDWDERYDTDEYRYGIEPIPFLKQAVDGIKPGRVLVVGAGEGRNAVWLAQNGWEVTALDLSRVGLEKAAGLASERGVIIRTVEADAAVWDMGQGCWDLVTEFFVHVPPEQRAVIHRRITAALAPGGVFVLEGFTPRQLGKDSGGPGTSKSGPAPPADEVVRRFIEPEELRQQMSGLEILRLEEEVITLTGGTHHDGGEGVVVHFIGRNAKTRDS